MEGISPGPDTAGLREPTSTIPSGETEEERQEDVTITPLDADAKDLSTSLLCVTDDLRVVRCSSVCDDKISKAFTNKSQVDGVFTDYLFDPRLSPIRPIEAKPLGGDRGQGEKDWLELGEKTYEELVSGISAMCETNHDNDSVFENDLDIQAKLQSGCTVVSSTPDLEMLKKDKFKTLFDVKDSENYPGHRHLPYPDMDFCGKGSRRASASCPPSFIGSPSHSLIIGQPGRFKDVDVSRQTDADATIVEETSDTGPDVLGLDEFTTFVDSDEDMQLMTIDEWQTVLHNSSECSRVLEGKLAQESVSEDIEKGKKRKPSEAFVIDLQENLNEVQEFMLGETVLDTEKQTSPCNLVKKQKTETTLCETAASEDDIRAIVKKQIADMVKEVSQMNNAEKLKLTNEATSEYLQRDQTNVPNEEASTNAVKSSPKKLVFQEEVEKVTPQVSHISEDTNQYRVSSSALEGVDEAHCHASECADSKLRQQPRPLSLEGQQKEQGIKVGPSNNLAQTSCTPVLPPHHTTELSPGTTIPCLDVSLRSIPLPPSPDKGSVVFPGTTIPCLDVSLRSIPLPPSRDKGSVSGHKKDQVNSIERTNDTVLSTVDTVNTPGYAPFSDATIAQKPELNEEQNNCPGPFQINALLPADKTKAPCSGFENSAKLSASKQKDEGEQNSNLLSRPNPSNQSSSQIGRKEFLNEKCGKPLVTNKPLSELSNLPRKSSGQNSGFQSEDKPAHIPSKVQRSSVKQGANIDNENAFEKSSPLKRKASPTKAVSSVLNISTQRAKVFKSSKDSSNNLTSDKILGPEVKASAVKVDTDPQNACAKEDLSPKGISLISLSTSVLSEEKSTSLSKLSQGVHPEIKIPTSAASSAKASLSPRPLSEPKAFSGKKVASKVNASTLSSTPVKTNLVSVDKPSAPLTPSSVKHLVQPLAVVGKTSSSTVAPSASSVENSLAEKNSAKSSTLGKGVGKPMPTLKKTLVSANKTPLITSTVPKNDGHALDSAKLPHTELVESSKDQKKLGLNKTNKGALSSITGSNSSLSGQIVISDPDVVFVGATKVDKLTPSDSTAKAVTKTDNKITFQRQVSVDSAIPRKVSVPTIQRQISLDSTVATKVEKVERSTATQKLKSAPVVSKTPQYLSEDNELIQQVKKRWDCKAIPSPETNLTCANYWRRNQAKVLRARNSLLEGDFRFSPLIERMKSKEPAPSTAVQSNKRKRPDNYLYLNPSDGYMWDGKRARYDQHVESAGEASASIQFQKEKLEQNLRERIREIHYQEERMKNELYLKHELQNEKVLTQQREEMQALYVRSYDHHNLPRSVMWLRQQHQLQVNELREMYYRDEHRLGEEAEQWVTQERKNYFEIAEQLEQLMNKEKTKSYQHTGQNVTYKMINLVKAPCRSNNQKKSWVKVYLPADVGSSIIREDLIYDAFYVY